MSAAQFTGRMVFNKLTGQMVPEKVVGGGVGFAGGWVSGHGMPVGGTTWAGSSVQPMADGRLGFYQGQGFQARFGDQYGRGTNIGKTTAQLRAGGNLLGAPGPVADPNAGAGLAGYYAMQRGNPNFAPLDIAGPNAAIDAAWGHQQIGVGENPLTGQFAPNLRAQQLELMRRRAVLQGSNDALARIQTLTPTPAPSAEPYD